MVETGYRHVPAWRADPHRIQHDVLDATWSGFGRTLWFCALPVSVCRHRGFWLPGQRLVWQLLAGGKRRAPGAGRVMLGIHPKRGWGYLADLTSRLITSVGILV